jgi:hypothetical protein
VADDESWLVLARGGIDVVLNLGDSPARVPLRDGAPDADLLLTWEPVTVRGGTGGADIDVPAHGVAVLRPHSR